MISFNQWLVALGCGLALAAPAQAAPGTEASSPKRAQAAPASGQSERRLIFVVIDGVRWQEVFRGADPRIAGDLRRDRDPARIRRAYLADDRPAQALTPFLHSLPAQGGVLTGDRDHDTCLRVGNRYWFSYPGYNEMLTGRTDSWANTNDAVPNPDISFLEWANRQPGYAGRVRAYATWDNFRNILSTGRSGIPVNAPARPLPASGPADGDARTHAMALRSVNEEDPAVLFVVYGDSDHFAHIGRYEDYLDQIHRVDGYLRDLWSAAQANPRWAGRTTLIVTTDHGRGRADFDNEAWRHHGSGFDASPDYKPEELEPGSDQTWAAYLGPRPAVATAKPSATLWPCPTSSQLAATALDALGMAWRDFNPSMSSPLFAPPEGGDGGGK